MAATELLATGTTLANSADFTIVAGAPRTLFLKYDANAGGPIQYFIQHKNADSTYTTKVVMTPSYDPLTLDGSGVFRAQRQASAASSGLDID
jgi:hypothetical protein